MTAPQPSTTRPADIGVDWDEIGLSAVLTAPGFRDWRAQVEALRGCAAPIHLQGSSRILDASGALLVERTGTVLAPCGNRRESVCPACSDRYAADAYHLVRAGLAGDDTKGVRAAVVEHPRAFLTLTAPSFGKVHTRTLSPRGLVIPCSCGESHRHGDDPRIGIAIDPDGYDYVGAVLWQAHAGALWSRFTIALRRALAAQLGIVASTFKDHARLSFAKVAEYQRRGLVHYHAVIRLDGPDGPTDPPPPGLDHHALCAAVRHAARIAVLHTTAPDGLALTMAWGTQLELRPVTPTAAAQLENAESGELTDAALAGYIAKYATKGTGTHDGVDRPIRDIGHVAMLPIPYHHKRMITTAWELGGHEQYAGLQLRRWAHMLGFRGHFLTKSRRYSTTFTALRGERRQHRLAEELAGLDADDPDPDQPRLDVGSVIVVNDWWPVQFGHRSNAERELALAMAERIRTERAERRHERRQERHSENQGRPPEGRAA